MREIGEGILQQNSKNCDFPQFNPIPILDYVNLRNLQHRHFDRQTSLATAVFITLVPWRLIYFTLQPQRQMSS